MSDEIKVPQSVFDEVNSIGKYADPNHIAIAQAAARWMREDCLKKIKRHLPKELPADNPDVLRLVEGIEAGMNDIRPGGASVSAE